MPRFTNSTYSNVLVDDTGNYCVYRNVSPYFYFGDGARKEELAAYCLTKEAASAALRLFRL